MRTKIGALLAALLLAAPGAGIAACGEDDVDREVEQTERDAEKAAEDAKREAEEAKEDVEDAVGGE